MALYLGWYVWKLTMYSQFVWFISSTLYHPTITIWNLATTAATITATYNKNNNKHQIQQRQKQLAKTGTTSSFKIDGTYQ